jgi:hypothetical protein
MKRTLVYALILIILIITAFQFSNFVIAPREVYLLSNRQRIPTELDIENKLFKEKAIIEQLHKVLKEEKMYLSKTLNREDVRKNAITYFDYGYKGETLYIDKFGTVYKLIRKADEIGNKSYFHKMFVEINGIFDKSNFLIYASKPSSEVLGVVNRILIIKSGGAEIHQVEKSGANYTLIISNQGSKSSIEIKAYIDEKFAFNNNFELLNQHNWISFYYKLSEGSHKLRLESEDGAFVDNTFEITKDKHWALADYWFSKRENAKESYPFFTYKYKDKPFIFK